MAILECLRSRLSTCGIALPPFHWRGPVCFGCGLRGPVCFGFGLRGLGFGLVPVRFGLRWPVFGFGWGPDRFGLRSPTAFAALTFGLRLSPALAFTLPS